MHSPRALLLLASAAMVLSACKDGGGCDPTGPPCGPVPSISIADVTVGEGTGGTIGAVFAVTLSAAPGTSVTVQYATADGTATAPDDFDAVSGTLTINAGQTSGSVTVPVVSDIVGEAASETFTVVLTAPTNATIADGTATGTITDDDDCAPAATLTPGETVTGDLADTDCLWTAPTDYFDLYLFSVSDTVSIAVDLTSNAQDIDPFVALFSLDGTEGLQDDNGGYELNARRTALVAPGTYVIFAAAATTTGETGSYELSVTEVPTDASFFGSTAGGSNDPSDLYTIEPATGVATLLGAIGFDNVGAIAFHPTTDVLYGEGARAADGVRVLISIDRVTGAGTEIGPTGADRAADLAFRADGALFLYTSKHDLYTVDVGTGSGSAVGPSGISLEGGNGIVFGAAGALYHSDREESHTLNAATGAATYVADMDFPSPCQTTVAHLNGGRFSGSDRVNGTGESYGIVRCDAGSDSPAAHLGQVDFTTGYVILIGRSEDNMDGFAILD